MSATRSPAAPRSRKRRWLRMLMIAALAWVAVTELAVLSLRFVPPLTSAFMIERWLGAQWHGERGFALHYHWVPWRAVAPVVPLAMVASEDQTFPSNYGFDFGEIRDAIDQAEEGDRLRGASTITQQTAKNLFLWGGRSFVRKGIEAYFTVLLELNLPKRRILEIYMNIAELGNGIYGVDAASRIYFHEPPARLNEHEAALLASVLPNPRRYRADRPSPYVLRHAAWVERQMHQLGGVSYLPK